jgi:hypothetical protein
MRVTTIDQHLIQLTQWGAVKAKKHLDKMASMFRAIVCFGLITAAVGSEKLDVLVNAAASFSATIQQQLETLQSGPSPAELAEKTIDYAEAKTAYFNALRAELPELMKIATCKEARPPGP